MLWMNPRDAARRDFQDKQTVMVANTLGSIQMPIRVTSEIMEGVVCLMQGVWPDSDENGMDQGGAANFLTSTEPTEPSIGSRTHSVAVEVSSLSSINHFNR